MEGEKLQRNDCEHGLQTVDRKRNLDVLVCMRLCLRVTPITHDDGAALEPIRSLRVDSSLSEGRDRRGVTALLGTMHMRECRKITGSHMQVCLRVRNVVTGCEACKQSQRHTEVRQEERKRVPKCVDRLTTIERILIAQVVEIN